MAARGSTTGKLAMAAEIASARLRRFNDSLDTLSDAGCGTVLGGQPITRADHLTLLANSPEYQAHTLATLPFANESDRARLVRDLQQVAALYPERLPPGVSQAPRLGVPELDQGAVPPVGQ